VQKAIALNPSLRAQVADAGSLIERLGEAKADGPAVKGQKSAAPRSLTDVVRDLKASLDEQRKAIAVERAALDKRDRELRPVVCEQLIDAVLAIDPNMTSPKTAYLLQQERAFLDAIGFSTQRLVERESRRGDQSLTRTKKRPATG
jgi:hypothetical protein